MAYVTYEFYTSHFSKLSETEFDKYIDEAESFIDLRGRINVINDLKDNEENEVSDIRILPYKLSICNILNAIYDMEGESDFVTSISNGGYSESYEQKSKDERLMAIAKRILSGSGVWGVQYV